LLIVFFSIIREGEVCPSSFAGEIQVFMYSMYVCGENENSPAFSPGLEPGNTKLAECMAAV
jgi:hypothetical protein